MSTPEAAGLSASLIAQLHGLVALLESKPDLPLSQFCHADVRYYTDTPEEVDAVAAILGVPARWNKERTHYEAELKIGPNVSYEALCITREHSQAYAEHMAGFDHGRGGAPE